MNSAAYATAGRLGMCVLVAVLSGCQSTRPAASEEATQRWNMARARVKAKLAIDQFESGNVAAAAGELAEAHRLDPDNPGLTALRARIFLAGGNVAAAAELLERTHLEGKEQAEIEYLLGVVRQQQERWSEAADAFRRASRLDDREVAYIVAATQALLQLGQPRAALELLESSAPRFGWTSAYQAALAECREQLDEWSAAAMAWQRVAAASDVTPDIRERLGTALYRAGRYADAATALSDLLDDGQASSPDLLRLMLAECYLEQGQHATARRQVELFLRSEPDDMRALRLLARCLGAAGEYESALRVTRRALAQNAGDITTLELTAALAWRSGDAEQAASVAGRLRRLDRDNLVARRILQQVLIPAPSGSGD